MIRETSRFADLDGFAAAGVPHEWLTSLRANDPVSWQPTEDGGGFWLVTRHADVVEASRDWRTFSSDNSNGGIMGLVEAERQRRIQALVENTFVTMDPPEHSKYRKVVTSAMLPSAVAAVARRVREISVELIEAAIAKGTCDFVLDISAWIPLEALAELADIPVPDRRQLFEWVNALAGPDDPEYAASFAHALEGRRSLQRYCENLYEQRKDHLGEDVLSMMVAGEIDGEPISARRAAAFFELLIGAGSETTRTALSHGMLELARHPEQYRAMRADPELRQTTAIDEILRWATPITYFRRGATVDCELGGQPIKAGDSVILCYASANRDEAVFDDPFVFDVSRKPNRHVSFGAGGPHNCLGANLARLEMKIFFEELCARVAAIELASEPDFLRSNMIHGIKHLPIRLHPIR